MLVGSRKKHVLYWTSNSHGFTQLLGQGHFMWLLFSGRDRVVSITTMWSIWSSYNRWTLDGDKFDPANSVRLTRDPLALLDILRHQADVLPGHGWQPPKHEQIKINKDVAVVLMKIWAKLEVLHALLLPYCPTGCLVQTTPLGSLIPRSWKPYPCVMESSLQIFEGMLTWRWRLIVWRL